MDSQGVYLLIRRIRKGHVHRRTWCTEASQALFPPQCKDRALSQQPGIRDLTAVQRRPILMPRLIYL